MGIQQCLPNTSDHGGLLSVLYVDAAEVLWVDTCTTLGLDHVIDAAVDSTIQCFPWHATKRATSAVI